MLSWTSVWASDQGLLVSHILSAFSVNSCKSQSWLFGNVDSTLFSLENWLFTTAYLKSGLIQGVFWLVRPKKWQSFLGRTSKKNHPACQRLLLHVKERARDTTCMKSRPSGSITRPSVCERLSPICWRLLQEIWHRTLILLTWSMQTSLTTSCCPSPFNPWVSTLHNLSPVKGLGVMFYFKLLRRRI